MGEKISLGDLIEIELEPARAMPAQAPLPTMAVANSHPGPDVATNLLAQIERLWANLRGLGVRRLSALALIGVAVFATTGLAAYSLNPPDDGDTLFRARPRRYLRHRRRIARSGRAFRRQCREHGRSDPGRSGGRRADDPGGEGPATQRRRRKELYDKLGSLGLTSFMQDVTRLRALEG